MRQSFLLIAAALALPAALHAAEPEKFTIKNERARTGSLIRTERVTLNVPPDKGYAELSEAQKAGVKAIYENMLPEDEPPYPLNGPGAMLSAISDAQGKLRVEGELELVAKVAPDGKVISVASYKSPDPKLTKFAASVIALQQFKPAMCQGSPCEMEYPLRVRMTMKR